jgi:glycosyltransferase involved in cell wall biosynthesis
MEATSMTTPTVSVIIPAYNGAEFLAATIQSVLDQTYSNFELIVVDDASTDDTSQVVQQFDDPRVKFIQHQENQGSDVARHTGLQASSGEIIAFLDQDDLFHPAP